MKIVADENILQVKELFSDFGEVVTVPGRSMVASDLADADILLVRSVTKVNKALLEGSAVQFVGTATIGVDHLDVEYLNNAGIAYASAPGCNAQSVVEYIFSAVSAISKENPGFSPFQKSWGVVGCGNVGGSLVRQLQSLDQHVVAFDPFVDGDSYPLVSLDEVMSRDIICLHAPLTTGGDYPSYHLLAEKQLNSLKKGAVLISCGRGAVVDNQCLLETLKARPDITCVMDVWEGEPEINLALLPHVALATPHIAGYSMDGKLNGSLMLVEALAEFMKSKGDLHLAELSGVEVSPNVDHLFQSRTINVKRFCEDRQLLEGILTAYNIVEDDKRLRAALLDVSNDSAAEFDRLRKEYPFRSGFQHHIIEGAGNQAGDELRKQFTALGFQLAD